MNSPHTIVIRRATAVGAETLAQLAILDSRRPLTGPALIAEADGIPRVALDLDDGSVGGSARRSQAGRGAGAAWPACVPPWLGDPSAAGRARGTRPAGRPRPATRE